MKKIKNILKNNIKLFIGIIIGIIVAGTTAYGAILYQSSDVGYSNTSSGLTSTTVKGALDELITKENTWVNNSGIPQYYAFGQYKGWCNDTDANCNYSAFPTTSTTPPSGKSIYAVQYTDGGYGVCIKRSGAQYCFKGRNWIAEATHLQQVLSDGSCNFNANAHQLSCYVSDFYCSVDSYGAVNCGTRGTSTYVSCGVGANGCVYCA